MKHKTNQKNTHLRLFTQILASTALLATAPNARAQSMCGGANEAACPASGILATSNTFSLLVNVGGNYNAANDTISGGVSGVAGFKTISDMFDATNLNTLKNINFSYTDGSQSVVRLNYRGLPLITSTSANSPAISLSIPAIGISKVFQTYGTRDQNFQDLKDFIKKSGGDIVSALQKKLAEVSPVDPIAGNPASVQSRMVADDFSRGFSSVSSQIASPPGSGSSNLAGLALRFGQYKQGDLTSRTVTLPLSYTFRSDADARRQFIVAVPVAIGDVEGAKSYSVNPSVAYRLPVNEVWTLTPSVGFGVSGSADLGSAAAIYSASLTSHYVLPQSEGRVIAIGNMVGFYKTARITSGDYSYDPGISNTVLRNGVLYSIPVTLMDAPLALEFSLINTHFSGSALYMNQYNEIGLTVGTNKGATGHESFLRAGASIMISDKSKGFTANFGYWF